MKHRVRARYCRLVIPVTLVWPGHARPLNERPRAGDLSRVRGISWQESASRREPSAAAIHRLGGVDAASYLAWELVVTPNGDRLLDQRTGGNFIVSCKVKDYDGAASDVKVEWYKNGELASHIGNVMTIYKTYGNQLLINSPKISDGGAYTCKADVSGQLHETTVLITFADPPKFIDPETEQHPEEGSNAEIVCNVEGTEKLEVFWQFNDSILEEGACHCDVL
uniref:Ig-like domain-containing protein n=1 Tax=Angiostrongylus cantonensis TaxID=6313 RepID=A0A0K0D7K1_ANGCA